MGLLLSEQSPSTVTNVLHGISLELVWLLLGHAVVLGWFPGGSLENRAVHLFDLMI